MNGLTARAPRLLKMVGGKKWATGKDHEDDDNVQGNRSKRKSSTPIDAEPKSSSDVEADPLSSSDNDVPISSADIPGSFDSNGKSLGRLSATKGASPPKRRPVRAYGASSEPPRKLQKVSDDEDFDMFGEVKRKKSKAKTLGSNKIRSMQSLTYAKPKPEQRTFINPLASFSSPKDAETPPSKFKKKLLRTPTSNSRSHSSSAGKDNTYAGAEEYDSTPERNRSAPPAQKKKRVDQKIKTAPSFSDESPSSSAPEFKVFESLTQAARKFDTAELRKEREEEERREKERAAATELADEGQCPMRCGKMLPRRVLETLSPSASIKEQQRFCRRHQIEDAEDERKQKHYPAIDWENLSNRLERHNKSIAKMIHQPDHLHFRKEMEERNKKGRDRTLLQHMKHEGLESIGVGYYGSKGLDIMTEHIMKNFAGELRARAVSDKVIAARGAMGYVQMVLVLELATLLIKEDMDATDITARQIMGESTAMGDLLHPSETGKSRGRTSATLTSGYE